MNLSHKVRKLFSKRGYASASRHVKRFFASSGGDSVKTPFPLTPEDLFREFDGGEFQRIKVQYGVTTHTEANPKYISFPLRWLQVNIDRIKALELDFGPKRTVLDIGCGVGYFLYISKQLGHTAIGLDLDVEPIFREMTQLLEVDRRVWRIDAFVPLPDLGCKLDVVTAHLICFNGHKTDAVWGVKEWSYFFADLSRQLNPGAKIFFEMNPEPGQVFLSDELHAYFRDTLHAEISPSRRHVYLEYRKFAAAVKK